MPRTLSLGLTGLGLAVLIVSLPLQAANPAARAKVIQPFNGKDLTGWKFKHDPDKSKWVVGHAALDEKNPSQLTVKPLTGASGSAAELINARPSVDIYTEQKFGDCTIELEFMVPKGSNSGVYVMGEYEVQILDSYGKKRVNAGDLGALYGVAAPRINAAKKPGEWQKFVIELQAPRFENGKKVANARFLKITLNDQVIHENLEVKGPTPSGVTGKEVATGPLMFQGDHGPVAFRNIKITPRGTK